MPAERGALDIDIDCDIDNNNNYYYSSTYYHYYCYSSSYRRIEVGRWTKDSISALRSIAFWLTMHIMSLCRRPVDHMSNWLMKANGDRSDRMPTVVAFVCDFAPRLMQGWDDYLMEHEVQCWQVINDIHDIGMQAFWMSCAVATCVGMATDYYRRVYLTCRSYPLSIMWLIREGPEQKSESRREFVCAFLAATPKEIADMTCLKLRFLWYEELVLASHDGTCDPRLHNMIVRLAYAWLWDTQEIEGVNNTIRHCIKIAPYIQWILLSTRVCLRKDIARMSHSDREAVVDQCIPLHGRVNRGAVNLTGGHGTHGLLDVIDLKSDESSNALWASVFENPLERPRSLNDPRPLHAWSPPALPGVRGGVDVMSRLADLPRRHLVAAAKVILATRKEFKRREWEWGASSTRAIMISVVGAKEPVRSSIHMDAIESNTWIPSILFF